MTTRTGRVGNGQRVHAVREDTVRWAGPSAHTSGTATTYCGQQATVFAFTRGTFDGTARRDRCDRCEETMRREAT